MQAKSNSSYNIIPAVQVMQDLSITIETLFDLAKQEESLFLIDIPDTVEVYISDRDILGSTKTYRGRQLGGVQEKGELFPIHQDIKFLCIRPSECMPLIHREKIRSKLFIAVGTMHVDGTLELLNTHSYSNRYPDQNLKGFNWFGSFLTYQPALKGQNRPGKHHQPTAEASVSIKIEDLFLTSEDYGKIA
ncbi:MAG: hypothetical protein ABJZ98_16555, partial [Saccharospirillum sp.]